MDKLWTKVLNNSGEVYVYIHLSLPTEQFKYNLNKYF
jgi:hypothetical protein